DPSTQSLLVRRQIGYVSDNPALYDWMRVGEIGWFAAAFYSDGFLENYRDSIRRYQIPEDRKIKQLSKGMRAKVALSLALAHDPELLILDEPTSGLDPKVRREFLESMIDRAVTGRTVFLSSHQIAEVERVADRIAILHRGQLRLCEPLDQLKGSMTELMITIDDATVAVPRPPSPAVLIDEHRDGRQCRMIVRDFSPNMSSAMSQSTGVSDVRMRPMSLEDIFISLTRGQRDAVDADMNAAPERAESNVDRDQDSLTEPAVVETNA
ncbi:MAG: ABC transporter ATP-binding protein, partial [Planctomycetota bacterium]